MSDSDFNFMSTPAPAAQPRGIRNVRNTPPTETSALKGAAPEAGEKKAKGEETGQEPGASKETKASERPKYSPEELALIFDQIIFTGTYNEDVILKGKVRVTFRTRTTDEINEIQRAIDASGFNLISSVEMLRTTMGLEYALIGYHGKNTGGMSLTERKKFVSSLPGPVMGMLVNALMRFDQKVAAALQDGEENF